MFRKASDTLFVCIGAGSGVGRFATLSPAVRVMGRLKNLPPASSASRDQAVVGEHGIADTEIRGMAGMREWQFEARDRSRYDEGHSMKYSDESLLHNKSLTRVTNPARDFNIRVSTTQGVWGQSASVSPHR